MGMDSNEGGGRLFGYRASTSSILGSVLAGVVAEHWLKGVEDLEKGALPWDVVPVMDHRPTRYKGIELVLQTYAGQITLSSLRPRSDDALVHEARHLGAVAARTVLAAFRQTRDRDLLPHVPAFAEIPESRALTVGEDPHIVLGVLAVAGDPWPRLNLRIEEHDGRSTAGGLGEAIPGALQVILDYCFRAVLPPATAERRLDVERRLDRLVGASDRVR